MTTMIARAATPHMKGFDVNERVGPQTARALAANGYSFAVRYLPRVEVHPADLTATELADLLNAGLAVSLVQHVESETSWIPSGEKGAQYGATAAARCQALGIPAGVTVFLDLEGVAEGTDAAETIAYCQNWYHAVAGAGYEAGLYVGWNCGLSAHELYALPFTRYWAAYNLDADQHPATRGVCMKQHIPTPADFTAWMGIDVNTIEPDALGGLPTLLFPG